MSDQVVPSREWRFYIDDMIGFAQKVVAYTHDLSKEVFLKSGLNYDATLRNIELSGEAATHILRLSAPKHRRSLGARSSPRAISLFMATSALITTRCGASFKTMFQRCCLSWRNYVRSRQDRDEPEVDFTA